MSLPESVQAFVDRQHTRPVSELSQVAPEENVSPYASYWYRAVACMLLSGRVQSGSLDNPNRTDVNRVCKEANFNQYMAERIARFLVAAKVVARRPRSGNYDPGPGEAFWDHKLAPLQAITRPAVVTLYRESAGYHPQRLGKIGDAGLLEFVTLFWHCFQGRALREDTVGSTLEAFAELPAEDLQKVARALRLKVTEEQVEHWAGWLDEKGQKTLLPALGMAEWVYGEERDKTIWLFASAIGLAMLGLGPLPPVEPLPTDLTVQDDLSVLAGAGRPLEQLVPLFRHCRIQRIARICQLQIERLRLEEAEAGTSPGEELRQALADAEPLPAAVADLFTTKSALEGTIALRGCSAVVKPSSAEVLQAIRKHPRLKNYLEAKAPPGYLLLKAGSDPRNFIQRCRELGIEVTAL